MLRQLIAGAALAIVAAMPAAAEKIALAFGNVSYDRIGNAPNALRTFEAARLLGRGGEITVTAEANADYATIRQSLAPFIQMSKESDGQVIILSGKFANNGVETFFLPTSMPDPNFINLYEQAVPLSLFLALLAQAPDRGLLILSVADSAGPSDGAWNWGLGPLSAPEGVGIIHGSTRAVAGLVQFDLPGTDRSLRQAVAASNALVAVGTIPDAPFVRTGSGGANADTIAWRIAREADTLAAYRQYIDRFPDGANAGEARARIRELTEPTPQEREAALDLSRAERQQIQADLTVLGYDTRGVDGIFGQGSRNAISNWQSSEGVASTGFLTRPQVEAIARQASVRRTEIRRQDDAYWQQTGANGTAAGLRSYLDRYPRGEHASEARAALDRIEAEDRRRADDRLWAEARTADTAEAYRRYLDRFPDGLNADAAATRLAQLDRDDQRDRVLEAAAAQEAALGLSPIAQVLAERRLQQSGYNVGVPDGTFDDTTRQAIRQFQRDRDITPTGYLNEDTVAALISGGLRELLEGR